MKTFTNLLATLLIIILWGFQSNVYAQVDVTINPLPLLWGSVNAGVDVGLTENISTELQLGYTFANLSYTSYTGFPVTVLGKYYFSPNHGADRFYANLFLRYVTLSYEVKMFLSDDMKFKYTRMGGGIGIGYKVVSKGNFVFDINLGGGRAFYEKMVIEGGNGLINWSDLIPDWTTDVMIVGKIGLGYRF